MGHGTEYITVDLTVIKDNGENLYKEQIKKDLAIIL